MCLATVYVQNGELKEEVMRDVAWVEPQGCELRLVGLMGESSLLQAEILHIDLLHSSITVQRTAAELPQGASADRGERNEGGPV
jgi:predicted RNA-binding protein